MLVPRDRLGALATAFTTRGYVVTRSRDMIRVYTTGADPSEDGAIVNLVAHEANPVLAAAASVAESATVLGHSVRIVPRGSFLSGAEAELSLVIDDLRNGRLVKV